uniref:Regenerating family member 4 n=1 Tax=Accipiter nisus TaxID=211598 RepID=A0A8B9MS90_9AVES
MVAASRLVLLLLGSTLAVPHLSPHSPFTGSRYVSYCPKGWFYYKLSCFGYFRQPQSWDEAERECQSKHPGAHLAWVEEPREVATLQRIISYYQRVKPVWLGLHYGQEVSFAASGGFSAASAGGAVWG